MLGKLFVFEGANFVGKTTLSRAVAEKLQKESLPSSRYAFPGDEKGSLGKHIYEVHHHPSSFGINSIDPTSLQILHIAAHVDLIENRIQPDIKSGKIVFIDRFWWSTFVYGKVTGVNQASLKAMIKLEQMHWGNLTPSIVFYVDRAQPLENDGDLSRWEKIRKEYDRLIQVEKSRYPIVRINNESINNEAVKTILTHIRSSVVSNN